jgi:catechol 2,3-dioxygenase-like lactoylglutathione lyase family enzyme
MRLTQLRPILYSDKLEESIAFYTGVLGFTCGERNINLGWASLYRDEVHIMLAIPNEHIPFDKPTFTGSIYINTDNIEEVWQTIKDQVTVVYDIENFEWGMREFGIYDNNGYIIQFGQPVL